MIPSSRISHRHRLRIYDVICAAVAPFLAFWLRDPNYLDPGAIGSSAFYCLVGFAATLLALVVFGIGHPLSRYFATPDAIEILKACVVAAMITAVAVFTISHLESVPRSLPAIHVFVLGTLLIGGRFIASRVRRRRERASAGGDVDQPDNIIVIGANRLAWFYIRLLDAFPSSRQKVVAVLDPNPRLRGRSLYGHKVIGSPADLGKILDEYAVHGLAIDKIMLADSAHNDQALSQSVWSACADRGINLEYLADRLGLLERPAPRRTDEAACSPSPEAAGIRARPYWKLKRLMDVSIAGVLTFVLLPLIAAVALAVYADVGAPIVFWQRRLGRGRRFIFVYKFRTLRTPFDRRGTAVPEACRLSRLGALLRASRLDELPQLYNILRGDMSIVGPRPLLPADQPSDVSLRLAIPPGLTGWAQVHGGKLVTPDEKNALDEWYVRHSSFLLDIRILFLTAVTILKGDRRDDAAVRRAQGERANDRQVLMS
jgi:lipopolysaccharide/colanic/teichoic acid biosynthesis glycosyltransferase